MISLVTTYKNRRHHIEQTMPTWLDQDVDDYEIVLVDYNSEDDVAAYLRTFNTSIIIKHIRCEGIENFELAHARNIGSRYASGEWILFIDIDTSLFTNSMKAMSVYAHHDGLYFAAEDSQVRKEIINGGLILVKKECHEELRGFNELMTGWGFEDIDYKKRLESSGVSFSFIDTNLYTCLEHSDAERTQCYTDEKEISWTKNRQISLQMWQGDYGRHDDIKVNSYGGNNESSEQS